ncbi:LacI family DNA-binding transcriptional regulator [Yoonia sp. 2307UL14-13]|uniref:LacI family DNA-binding transcriptional regulator n=1 Tax=Yoonia sp. 2307UL14-13 TaxID=3126506 RepID=UPI0030B7EB25
MAVTLKEVAALAGVSRSAVSRCFTEGASVSPKTRAKIERAANELGYHPNALASSLTTGRTKLIGLVSNNFHNPIFLEVFDLFTRSLQERGLRPLLVNLSDETDPENSVRMLRQYSVDGVIVASSTLPVSFAESFHAAGVPVVHSFGRYAEKPRVNVVGIDNKEAGRMAAKALIDRGYNRIAMLAGPETATSTEDRLAGFLEAAQGVEVSTSFAASYSFDAGWDEMNRLIAAGNLAEAYFCGDDVLSIGALSGLQAAGYRVPDDIGLIGLNDMEMARWNNIDLTTIRQPIHDVVRLSVSMICDMLDDSHASPDAHLLRCEIIERGTLRPL